MITVIIKVDIRRISLRHIKSEHVRTRFDPEKYREENDQDTARDTVTEISTEEHIQDNIEERDATQRGTKIPRDANSRLRVMHTESDLHYKLTLYFSITLLKSLQ